jgi:rubrerythrin
MNTSPILELLKTAIDIERSGHDFYLKAAKTTTDINGKGIFSELADDEINHRKLLEKQYRDLSRGGDWSKLSEVNAPPAVLARQLFPPTREKAAKILGQQPSELEVLLFGIDIEVKSYDIYKNAADSTDNLIAKGFFEYLAGQEQGHFNTLMLRYDAISDPVSWYP